MNSLIFDRLELNIKPDVITTVNVVDVGLPQINCWKVGSFVPECGYLGVIGRTYGDDFTP